MFVSARHDDWLGFVAEVTGAAKAERLERVQSLWSGYGEIVRVRLTGAPFETVIVKHVDPPRAPSSDVSHARKLRSYEVETAFYREWATRCDATCKVARLFGERHARDLHVLVFEDLDAAGFAGRNRLPRGRELDACLEWLASFHARFVGAKPSRLWKIGTYWHLATRQDELAITKKRDPALAAKAPEIDRALNEARFRTLVHGDAKPANFCFGRDRVAAVDFQYVGGGVGVKDVAYLLHGEPNGKRALDTYFAALRPKLAADIDGVALEAEWRALYPLAVTDFERFLNGWR